MTYGSCRPRRRCASSARPPGRRCPATRSRTEVWDRRRTRSPHVRIGQEADLVVVAPATADLLARAAHGLADDLLTNTCSPPAARCCSRRRCTPRCGSTPPPGERRHAARARRARHRPGGRPADRCRHRQGPVARSGRDLRALPPGAGPRRPAPPSRTSPAARSWSPPAAPASRSTRCASSATARPASRATRSPGTRGGPRRPGHAGRRQRRAARSGRRRRDPRRVPPPSCARRR